MALTATGIKALRQVQDDIRKSIKAKGKGFKFDMTHWVSIVPKTEKVKGKPLPEGFCATAGCVAGTLCLNAGMKASWNTEFGMVRDYEMINPQGKRVEISKAARRILGVSSKAAEALFAPWDSTSWQNEVDPTNPFWQGLKTSRKKDAIVAIDRFIQMQGRLK